MKRTTNNKTDVLQSQEPKRAALYGRVSSDEQARGESIGDQMQALRKWAADNGHIAPLEYIDEGFSARKPYRTRPALRRLLDDVQAGRISIIAFVRLDRWFRSLKDYYAVQAILDAAGVEWTTTAEDYSTATTQGRLLLNLRLSIAEHEADQTGDRLRFTFAQKRARGEVVSGSMPWGYRIENKKPVKDEQAAPAVAAFWGEYTKTGRFRAAIDAANAAGGNLTVSHAGKILNAADRYAGKVQGIDTYAYITPEQAAAVQASRYHRARKTGAVHLFNGFIYCSACGGRMSAHLSTRRLKDGTKIRYTTYFCARAIDRKCSNGINLNQSKIEAALLERIEPELDAYIVQAETAQKAQKSKKRTDPRAKIKALTDKREKLLDLYLDGAINKAEFETRRKAIDDDIARLSAQPAETPPPNPRTLKAKLPAGWRDMYAELTDENKRAFWYALIARITVYPDRNIRISFP